MSSKARYAVGIDLGTTNCVIAAIDLVSQQGPYPEIHTIPLSQRIDEDTIGESLRLPSFLYFPTEAQKKDLVKFSFESKGWLIGQAAAELGRRASGRLITSSKSWLCHSRIDKTKNILPWGGADDIPKISPLEATTLLLKHLNYSWTQSKFGSNSPLNEQILTITLPASFDQTARALTLEACKEAGLENARLLEEPQAAFYSWISNRRGRWSEALGTSRKVLVCDIGGGTSDFSIVKCIADEEDFNFERNAVGRHLLLGGDNMDLSIAHHCETNLSSKNKKKLNQSQWQLLAQLTRNAKEKLLQENGDNEITIRLPGSGTKVIGGLRQSTLTKEDVESMIVNGFFPKVSSDYKSKTISSGLSDLGLPYEQETAITWHILEFIRTHCQSSNDFPDAILFNGGALEPKAIRQRICEVLRENSPKKEDLNILESISLANAVARGAAFYSYIGTRGGLKIGGGSPQAYYLELARNEGPSDYLCIIPKGTEAHENVEVKLEGLEAKTNSPVSFKLFQSDQFSLDESGTLQKGLFGQESIGKLNTTVKFGKQDSRNIPIYIAGELTELDTLNLELKSVHTPHAWQLEFDLRQSNQEENSTESSSEEIQKNELEHSALTKLIGNSFSTKQCSSILKGIEKEFNLKRKDLNIPSLRAVVDELIKNAIHLDKSSDHESTWLNSCSFCLRPGFGHPNDEQRLVKMWSFFKNGPKSGKDKRAQNEWAILWRRIAPGVKSGWQNDLYQRNKKGLIDKKGLADFKGEKAELWRMIASFEHIPPKDKVRLGNSLISYIKSLPNNSVPLSLWALERLGSRQPLYAHLDSIPHQKEITPWINELLNLKDFLGKESLNTLVELSRKTGDRNIDIDPTLVEKVIQYINEYPENNSEELISPLKDIKYRELFEQNHLLGEDLPTGLTISS